MVTFPSLGSIPHCLLDDGKGMQADAVDEAKLPPKKVTFLSPGVSGYSAKKELGEARLHGGYMKRYLVCNCRAG